MKYNSGENLFAHGETSVIYDQTIGKYANISFKNTYTSLN